MNKLQRLLFGEVREYAKAQRFDIVITDGVHLRDARGRHHRPRCWHVLQTRATKPAAAAGATAPRPSHPRSPETTGADSERAPPP